MAQMGNPAALGARTGLGNVGLRLGIDIRENTPSASPSQAHKRAALSATGTTASRYCESMPAAIMRQLRRGAVEQLIPFDALLTVEAAQESEQKFLRSLSREKGAMTKTSLHSAGHMSRRARKLNGPPQPKKCFRPNSVPEGKPWVWMELEMLESKAFRKLTLYGHRALWRVAAGLIVPLSLVLLPGWQQ